MSMNYFQTSDFPLATTLVALGFKMEYIDKSSERAEFCFNRVDGLDEVVQWFWRDEVRIEPKLFCMNQKILKSRLYGQNL